MDVRCRICGEPWDFDSIHDAVEERNPKPRPWMVPDNSLPDGVWELKHDPTIYEKYFGEVRKDFVKRGCIALGGDDCSKRAQSKNNQEIMDMIYLISGDDLDGAASDLEDAEWLGYLD